MIADLRFSEKQQILWDVLHNDKHELILSGGSSGGGKSFTACVWLITSCLAYEDVRYVLGRKTLKSLKESTLNTLLGLLNKWKISYNYNQIDLTITFNNKSKIILKELDRYPSDPNYERFGSSEYTGAFVDEVSEIEDRAIEVLRARLRWKNSE